MINSIECLLKTLKSHKTTSYSHNFEIITIVSLAYQKLRYRQKCYQNLTLQFEDRAYSSPFERWKNPRILLSKIILEIEYKGGSELNFV